MDKTLDLDELERVAREAGDAEWEVVDYEGGSLVIHADRENRVCFMATPGDSPGQMARIEARAVHIATFDPPTILTLIAAARPAVVSDEVVERMCATLDANFRQTKAGWPEFTDYRASCIAAMRAALALLPGGEGEGSSRSLPSRTTQEPQSPTPCDLEVTDRASQWMLENSEGRWLHNAEDGTFTSDPNLGLKWPNRTAADAFRLGLRGPLWALKLTEHVWIEPKPYDWTDAEDDIADVISDSMDMDWNSRDGARAVVAYLKQIGAKLP